MKRLFRTTTLMLIAAATALGGCASKPTNTRTFYTDARIISMESATRCKSGGGSGATIVGGVLGMVIGGHIGGSDRAKVANAILLGGTGAVVGAAAGSGNGRQKCNDRYYRVKVSYIDPKTLRKGTKTVSMDNRPYSRYLSNLKITVPLTAAEMAERNDVK